MVKKLRKYKVKIQGSKAKVIKAHSIKEIEKLLISKFKLKPTKHELQVCRISPWYRLLILTQVVSVCYTRKILIHVKLM